MPESCNLKKPCSDCGDIHLHVLHDVAQLRSINSQLRASESRVYLTPSIASSKVLLKVVPVLLQNDSKSMETFAVLDDGAQRTMILPTAVQQLQLNGECETLALPLCVQTLSTSGAPRSALKSLPKVTHRNTTKYREHLLLQV